jgi:hypothetical protein
VAALTNYMSPGEWATAFWVGHHEIHEKGLEGGDLSRVLRAGVAEMARHGYTFEGLRVDPDGYAHKVRMVEGCPAEVVADMVTGDFDARHQGKIAVAWAKEHIPGLDLTWLADALADKGE